MNILNWLRKQTPTSLQETPLEAKDPMDWKLTRSSTQWEMDAWCPHCKSTLIHEEMMANICNNCGNHFRGLRWHNQRSYRKIWNGKKWVWQFKYSNGPNGYEIMEEFPA